MIVKTKKYILTPKQYIKIALKYRLQQDWWVFCIGAAFASIYIFIHSLWFPILAIIGVSVYFLFWFVQFYGVRYLEEARPLFMPSTYEISGKNILVKLPINKAMEVDWKSIKKFVVNKDHFLIVISKAHLIHLPYKVFNTENDINFVKFLLDNKKIPTKK